jgi:hypothetical protein
MYGITSNPGRNKEGDPEIVTNIAIFVNVMFCKNFLYHKIAVPLQQLLHYPSLDTDAVKNHSPIAQRTRVAIFHLYTKEIKVGH